MGPSATILHCDLDAFFAAVEELDRPELAGRPVVVGGRPEGRGVVATCNYEARRYGIRSAMPLREAHRRCPHAVFLPVRHQRYREVSARVFAIFRQYAATVEPVSIDEAYLDLGGRPGLSTAIEIKRQVRRATGLVVSIGIGPNKLLAKVACELSKPDGLREIRADEAQTTLAPLPLRQLPGVGPKTEAHLGQWGVTTIGDLQRCSRGWLMNLLGSRGAWLYDAAHGVDDRPV
ncbi:MAG TPA: DNA polymerase IV, partial [Bacillota bacterium]